MDVWSAIILGLVQALTEFLPVSSSGHLVLAHALLNIGQAHGVAADAFAVAVHFGTLGSVFLVFFEQIRSLFSTVIEVVRRPSTFQSTWSDNAELRLAAAIIVGCIPAGVVGLLFKDQLEAAFNSPLVVCWALLGTGLVLLLTKAAPVGDRHVGLPSGLLIGLAQAVAIIPGVSRSGSTIATAMFLKIEREEAARYSFLLSLPVIAGATLLKGKELLGANIESSVWLALATGALVAFVVGVVALRVLMMVVKRGAFAHFGWYCLGVGFVGLFLI